MSKTKILIVEDEVIVAMHIQNSLIKLDYEVCGCVQSGDEALKLAADLMPDLILMDIVLKGPMDGIEAARLIKDNLAIPVVYMTGNADVPTISRARETNPYGYILKPVNILHLYSMIDTALNRHMLETSLAESESKYRFLTDKMSDMVWIMDMDLRTTYASPSMEKILGYTPEERYNQKIEVMLTPGSLKQALEKWAEELKLESIPGTDPDRTVTMEMEYYHKNGSTVWVENKMRPIRDHDGRLIGIHGVSRDITERRRAETALKEKTEELDRFFDLALDMLCIADTDGYFRRLNPTWEKTLGYPLDELLGKRFIDYLHPDDMESTMAAVGELVRGHDVVNFVNRYRCGDGSYRWVEWRSSSYMGKIIYAAARDITGQKEAEEALRRSETKFRSLSDSSPMGVFYTDGNGEVLYTNKRWQTLAGLSGDEAQGRGWYKAIHPDDLRKVIKGWEATMKNKRSGEQELRFVSPGGDIRWVHARVEPLLSDRGELVGFVGTNEDITERKLAEKALLENEMRYRALFDQSPVGVFTFDRDMRITECNENLAVMMDSKRELLLGLDLTLLKENFVIPRLKEVLEGGVVTYEGSYHGTFSDLSLWVSVIASPLRDAGGRVIGGMVVMENMTERNIAEAKLRVSEERNRLLVDNANEGIVVLQDWHFVFVNPRFVSLTGYTREHLRSREFTEFVHPEDREMISDRYRRRLEGDRTPFIYEARLVDRDGAVRWIELNSVLFSWEGKPAVLLFVRDIGERKQAEEERRKMEAQIQQTQKLESLGVLAGGIAHDFNNLLMAILGNIDLALLDLSPSSPSRGNLMEAAKASQRAADLCRQMLAYSGKGRFVSELISLNEIIEDMRHMLEVSVSKKAMLRYNLVPGLPAVEADATQMRQIIMNLVINASDAIGEQSGFISLSTGVMECDRAYLSETWLNEGLPEGTYVCVEVADTGCGMDPGMLAKIFDPFFTTKFTGRGLGLAAVLGIVRGHRGAIKLFSERGKGTTFKILLPAVARIAEHMEADHGREQVWRGSGTVLLVDDEETIRTLGRRMLERLGLAVVTASNGREALDLFRERPDGFDCVILDLTMPHMDGEEAFRELRIIRDDVCVIMSSGYNEQEITHRFSGNGPSGFIQKPYQVESLAAKLKEVLG